MILLNGVMSLQKIKVMNLIEETGDFIPVNGMKIFIQDILFMFLLEGH
jgi:hypothetical protein